MSLTDALKRLLTKRERKVVPMEEYRSGERSAGARHFAEVAQRAGLDATLVVGSEAAAFTGPPQSFTCPLCSRVSWNPYDRVYRYCSACAVFVDDGVPR